MIKAVVFDMDGVLIDSENFYRSRTIEYLNHLGKNIDESKLNVLAGGSQKQYSEFLCEIFEDPNYDFEAHEEGYQQFYSDKPVDLNSLLFDGVEDILRYLKAEGYRIALASSSLMKHIEDMVDSCGLREYFEILLSGEMFHESKPNPEIYLNMAERLGLDPKECVAIEDSTYGLRAATDAGYHVVAKWDDRFGYDQTIAKCGIHEFEELKLILKNLNK